VEAFSIHEQLKVNFVGQVEGDDFVIDSARDAMPEVCLKIEAPQQAVVEKIEYRLKIRFKDSRLNIASEEIIGSCQNGGSIEFGSTFMGGQLSGMVRAFIRRRSGAGYWSDKHLVETNIIAVNPSFQEIVEFVKVRQPVVIAHQKSKLRMFNQRGQPYFNGGYGLAQLAAPSIKQLWSWRANISACAILWNTRLQLSEMRPATMKQSNFKQYKGLPEFSPEQIELECYELFSGRHYLRPIKKGVLFKKWVWDRDNCAGTFADSCKAVEQELFADMGA